VTDDLALQWWPADRIAELQAFIDREWRRGHILARDAGFLRWQHPPRPDGRLSVAAATLSGRLVGILGAVPVDFCVRGDVSAGAWLTTWFVTPAARASQAALGLFRFVDEAFAVLGTVGGNSTTQRLLRALGFTVADAMPRWVAIPMPSAYDRLVGVASGLSSPAAVPAVADGAVVGWHPQLAAGWDDVWRRIAPRFVGTGRDSRYLRRRYLEHPAFGYEVRVAVDAGVTPVGLGVYRIEYERDSGIPAVRMVELLGSPDACELLAAHVLAEAGRINAAFVDFYCTSDAVDVGLERTGFRPEVSFAGGVPSRLQPYDPARRSLSVALRLPDGSENLREAYVTRSDCDQDRPT
jgi:hypothetical protein